MYQQSDDPCEQIQLKLQILHSFSVLEWSAVLLFNYDDDNVVEP